MLTGGLVSAILKHWFQARYLLQEALAWSTE